MSACLCSSCGHEVSHGAFVYFEGMCHGCRKNADRLAHQKSLEFAVATDDHLRRLQENMVIHVMMGSNPAGIFPNVSV